MERKSFIARFAFIGVAVGALLCVSPTLAAITFTRQVLVGDVGATGAQEVRALKLDGDAALFFNAGGSEYLLQRQGSSWIQSTIYSSGPSTAPGAAIYMDATIAADGTPYVGIGYRSPGGSGSGFTNGVRILDRVAGSWKTVFNQSGSDHYGGSIAMGTVNGTPVATYTGNGAASSGFSSTAKFLELNGSTWQESQLGLPNNGGITHLEVGQIGSKPTVLVDTDGGFGAFLDQRSGATWTATNVPVANGSGALLGNSTQPQFFEGGSIGGAVFTQSGSTLSLQQLAPGPSHIVGSDFEVINGVLTAIYDNNGSIHFAQFLSGAWTDQIIDQGSISWEDGISLVDLNGHAGIAYVDDRPSGAHSLVWLEAPAVVGTTVPLPNAALAGIACLPVVALALRRSKRTVAPV